LRYRAALQPEYGHTEGFLDVVGVDPAERQEAALVESKPGPQPPELLFHHVCTESIMAGLDGRMSGQNGLDARFSKRLIDAEPIVLHSLTHSLQQGKGAVAFVQVDDGRTYANCAQRPQASDTEQDLLADPGQLIASVQTGGELS
jgi:hypothetical protein